MGRKKNRNKDMVVRAKAQYPRVKHALRSLEEAGYKPHTLKPAGHTGTYWRWRVVA